MVKYETERLIVREWTEKDCADLYEFASDEEITKYLHYKTYASLQDAVDRIKYILEMYKEERRIGEFAGELKGENKVIGAVSISSYKKAAGGSVKVGWTLNKKYQGKGYMTECAIGLFKYIKQNKIAKRIEATHDVENVKSGLVMKRAGMTLEGISRKAGENNFHSRYDVANYSILEEEIE